VHPSGDVIATMDGGTGDTVYDLAPDQPSVRWSFGSGASTPIGAVNGGPAIGAGGANSARTYVARSTATANGVSAYYGVITDGTNLYAAIRAGALGSLQRLDQSFTVAWTRTLTTNGFTAEPTIGIDGKIYAPDNANTVTAYDASTGAPDANMVLSFGGNPLSPLQGSDGHIYAPRKTGFLGAYEGTQVSWVIDPPGASLRFAMMDCSGRLFLASGATVYAVITDDHGLADTPWPSAHRDARNSGNAGAPKYGIRTASGCTQ
jgi:outer membrane protein assembly factor BamB